MSKIMADFGPLFLCNFNTVLNKKRTFLFNMVKLLNKNGIF